ncbi:MAG: AgmX/PglI C-terminal domain-containing protein, partial [Myxococcota bacterium]
AAVGLVALATAKVADDPGQGALVAERQPDEVREALPAAAAAPRTAPEAMAPARPSAVAHVTAVAGIGPELQRTGQAPTTPGGVLREGDRLVAPVDTEVHVALLPGSSMTLVGPGALLVRRLRGAAPERAAEVLLELEHGRLRSQVAPGTDYAVSSAPYTVRVRGTRFEVARAEGDAANTPLGTRVDVAEGVVEVAGEGELRRLTAPARWSSPEMTVDAPASGDVPSPYDPGALTDVALLRLPAMEGVARWQVAGAGVSGRRLALLLPVGERRRVEGFDAAGELVARTLVTLGPEGRSLEERHMSWPQEPREGVLRPEQIRPVVARAQRRLRSCYERELRRNPTLGSQGYQLRVRVTPQGRVAQASAAGPASAPSSLRGCLEREARSWTFPEPDGGGPVVFELPVNLAPRR